MQHGNFNHELSHSGIRVQNFSCDNISSVFLTINCSSIMSVTAYIMNVQDVCLHALFQNNDLNKNTNERKIQEWLPLTFFSGSFYYKHLGLV